MRKTEFFRYIIQSLLRPALNSRCNITDLPPAPYFYSHADRWQSVLICMASMLTCAVLLLSGAHWWSVWTFVSVEKRRNHLYFLLSLFPVSCACCMVGLCVPRAAGLLSAVGVLYYLLCLFVVVALCRHLYGGREAMVATLQRDQAEIDFRSPPCCCILPRSWLPTAPATEANLRRIEWAVLQAPLVRAIIVVVDSVAIAEMRDDAIGFMKWTDTGAVASLLLAIFGVHSMARLTSDRLSRFSFMTVFRLVDFSLLLFTAQQPMIFDNILIRFDLIVCGPVLSAEANAKFVCSFLLVVQMFLLSLACSFLLRPARCGLFDRYESISRAGFAAMRDSECEGGCYLTDQTPVNDADL